MIGIIGAFGAAGIMTWLILGGAIIGILCVLDSMSRGIHDAKRKADLNNSLKRSADFQVRFVDGYSDFDRKNRQKLSLYFGYTMQLSRQSEECIDQARVFKEIRSYIGSVFIEVYFPFPLGPPPASPAYRSCELLHLYSTTDDKFIIIDGLCDYFREHAAAVYTISKRTKLSAPQPAGPLIVGSACRLATFEEVQSCVESHFQLAKDIVAKMSAVRWQSRVPQEARAIEIDSNTRTYPAFLPGSN